MGAKLDPKTANILYHDAAAASYDEKWAISFDERSRAYVRERAERMLPRRRYRRALEVGTGTGFFLLNLWQEGFVEEPHATDVSTGMLRACVEHARRIGCDLRVREADVERLPYGEGEFDLVVAHAMLHHVPDPPGALREMTRVLRPGGSVLIAGEPTRAGDRIAGVAKRLAYEGFRLADRLVGGLAAPEREPTSDRERILRDLEFAVDLHTFEPEEVARWAREAGLAAVRVETEELLASVFGWTVRTVEALARPGLLGDRWAAAAYGGWRVLCRADRALASLVPSRLFYNLLLSGERPG
jgi:ubiquinone/menaquinone biosynthesis C-methylase UbiE